MELSSYTRLWLDNAQGPKAVELRAYIKFLENKVSSLNDIGITKDDECGDCIVEEMNPTTALFNRYGG